jgi:putative chitinase
MTISHPQLATLAPRALPVYLRAFDFADSVLPAYSISTVLRVQQFCAQVLHECGGLTILRENMNYSAEALADMFGNRITPAQAQQFGRTDDHLANQQAIANIIYGGLWGLKNLGNTQPNDGWEFRGCYLLQHTGRDFFSRMATKFGVPLVSICDPSKIDPRLILMMACEEWSEKGCNVLADRDDLEGITRKINGGTNGLDSRAAWLAKVKKVVS